MPRRLGVSDRPAEPVQHAAAKVLVLEVAGVHALVPDHLALVGGHDDSRHLVVPPLQRTVSFVAGTGGGSQLSQRPAFELADALGAEAEATGHVAQARRLAVEPKPRFQDGSLAVAQPSKE